MDTVNTIVWNSIGYYLLGSVLCILAQLTLLLILLAQRRRAKRKIRALHASEHMYRLLTENAQDMISRHAADGRILYISPVCREIFGYSPDDILGHEIEPYIHPDDIQITWDAIYAAVTAGKEHYTTRYRIRHKQGHWVWAETRGRVLYDNDGELAEIHCLARDITDRKQIEDTLRANEEKFRALFGLVPVVSSVSSFQEGRFLEVNETFLQTLGFQRDDVIGKTAAELNLWVDPAGRAQILEPLRQRGSFRDLEIDVRTTAGVVLHTLFSCEVVEIGGQQCLITAFTDITERTRSEAALRESEAKFRTIFENAPVTMAISRMDDGTYLDVNQKFVTSTGFSKEDILGKKPLDGLVAILEEPDFNHFTPSDHALASQKSGSYLAPEVFQHMYQEYRVHGKLENFYFRSITWDGQVVHNLTSAYPIRLQGELCVLTIVTDITELKKAEEELREREEKYRMLFENMAQGAMYRWADGRVEEVNAAVLEMFGVSADELIEYGSLYRPGLDIIHEDGSKLSVDEWPTTIALTTRNPVRNMTVGVFNPQQQAYVWVTIAAIPQFKAGETRPYRVFTTFHNVTELKRAEQELRIYQEHLEHLVEERTRELQREIEARKQSEQFLRESEAKYRLIAENATDVIWTANTSERFTYISPSVQRLRGYTPEEAIQETFEQVMTAESWKKVLALLSPKYIDEEGPLRVEIEQTCKDGSTVWVEAIVRRLYDASGARAGILGISRDISERKQAEAALQTAKDAALAAKEVAEKAQKTSEAANRAKSMFLSNMSHELRTPLNAILGFAQLLARETTLSSVQREYLGTINRSGEHLLQLVNDVLDMSKIEAGRISMNPSSFDLRQMLANVEEMIRIRAEQKGLELYIEYPDDMPRYIITDEKKLRQILINVLGNAVKFTEHGNVTLEVETARRTVSTDDAEHVQTGQRQTDQRPASTRIQFEIKDTGPGISAEGLSTIFEAFRQTSHMKDNEGTGLGLAISRKFAQLLGGGIQVESGEGRGSLFRVDIHVELAEQANGGSTSFTNTIAGLASPQEPVRILVVDDHAASRRLIHQLLGGVGFDVNEAANGLEALTMLKEWTPDLILMDMVMPVMDGYTATKKIRDAKSQIPIIAMTASVFEEDQQQILTAGCNMLLRKPVSIPELFEAIRTYLGVEYV
jgi:PAS domain S-box-containing protein